MEKKLKYDLNKIFLAILVLIISLGASTALIEVQGWWFPVIGGVISIFGLYLGKTKILNLGALLLVTSFFFLIQGIPFNYFNLFFIIFAFFFFFGLWIFMKRELLVSEIKNDLVGSEGINYLENYKKDSALYYLKTLLMGLLVSLTGGMIAAHSFIGPLPSGMALFLNVFFSVVILLALYSVLFLLPKYFIVE